MSFRFAFAPLGFSMARADVRACRHLLVVCTWAVSVGLASNTLAIAQTSATLSAAALADAVPVIVTNSSETQDSVVLELPSSGLAQRSVTLFPQVEGEVEQVVFRTGQQVKAGELLVRLSDRAAQSRWRWPRRSCKPPACSPGACKPPQAPAPCRKSR
jgi:acetyl/propionyl-CoA carboxylase alpha subunit